MKVCLIQDTNVLQVFQTSISKSRPTYSVGPLFQRISQHQRHDEQSGSEYM